MRRRSHSPIDTYKLIYQPLIMGLIAIALFSALGAFLGRTLIINQQKNQALQIAMHVSDQIKVNREALTLIDSFIDDRLTVAADSVIEERPELSSNYLGRLKELLQVDELHWMAPDGTILYSTVPGYIGWIPDETHPLYDFVRSDEQVLIEDVRPDALYGIPVKYAEVKASDGYFVQVGIYAEAIDAIKDEMTIQNTLKRIIQSKNVLRAGVITLNEEINSGDVETITQISMTKTGQTEMIFDQMIAKASLAKGYAETEFFNDEIADAVARVYIPIDENGSDFLLLDVDTSRSHTISKTLVVLILGIGIAMGFLFWWIQRIKVVKPIIQLSGHLDALSEVKDKQYRFPLDEDDAFLGLNQSLNALLESNEQYVNELNEQKQELYAAYEQLTAADEELKGQFDEIEQYSQKLEYNVKHDQLTGLINRVSFVEVLRKAIAADTQGAVILLDLDDFKGINDTLGHNYGDLLLARIAKLLKRVLTVNRYEIARIGGDEFVIGVFEVASRPAVENVVLKILDLFGDPIDVEGQPVFIGCSIGVCLFSGDEISAENLIMNADMAMYASKRIQKGHYQFYEPWMNRDLIERIEAEHILREALQNEDFKLVFQPQVDIHRYKVAGLEALIRMKHHDMSPNIFIPIAEETGMIIPIGRWVAEEAIAQIAAWNKMGIQTTVAINFSGKQMKDKGFANFLVKTLEKYGVSSNQLEVEVTESIFIGNQYESIHFLNDLRTNGISIALDDFGTGYSSLNYLTYLPINRVKLDRAIVERLLEAGRLRLMESMIALLHSIDAEVVAEGVETVSHCKKLKECNCDVLQGYYFSKPVDVEAVEAFFAPHFKWPVSNHCDS